VRPLSSLQHGKKEIITMTATTPQISSRGTETEQLCAAARQQVSANSANATDCRELALMLGLIRVGPSGALERTSPWDADVSDPLPGHEG
jgi:hypothetical protein